MTQSSTTEVVVFDLGGVLVRLGGEQALGRLLGEPAHDAVWRIWLTCPWVRRYERGACTRAEFGEGMVAQYGLDLSPEAFLEEFRTWPQGLYEGAAELVQATATRMRTACFSNTNELHWGHQRDAWRLGTLFDHTFVSHELGLVKPDAEAFEHVVEALGCRADQVLFLDDNQLNVDGARAVGLDAHRTVGLEAVRTLLRERGFV